MQSIELGSSGLYISRLGFGGCPLGGHGWGPSTDAAEGIAAVRRAFDLGVNLFDTADVYGLGKSESLLAEALGPNVRNVIIASKFGVRWTAGGKTWKDIRARYMEQALDSSLKRLRLDCIPLYYIHWPDNCTPVEETVLALEKMRQAGKIRAIGLSNFSAEDIDRACKVGTIDALQLQYSLVNWEAAHAVSSVARTHRIPFITWGSLAQGLLSGKYDASTVFAESDRRHRYENFRGAVLQKNLQVIEVVKQLAAGLNRTPTQVAIRWLLQTENVGSVLVGAKRPSQIEENLGAFQFSLSPDQYSLLTDVVRRCLLDANAQSTHAGAA